MKVSGQDDPILSHLLEMKEQMGRIEEQVKGLPERVSRLERWQSYLKGAWAVVTAAFIYLFLPWTAKK